MSRLIKLQDILSDINNKLGKNYTVDIFFDIFNKSLEDDDNNKGDEYNKNKLDELIRYYNNIKRGDIISYNDDEYKNNSKVIWSGNKLEYLDYSLDDCGNLPSTYTLNEFSYDHFDKTISNNNIRYS